MLPSDRQIWAAAAEKNDPSIITSWYWDWDAWRHPKQQEWLRATSFREKYLTTGARFGKSEATAVDLLLDCCRMPGQIICNTSITQDQAEIAWNIATDMAIWSPRFSHWVSDVKYSPFPRLILRNGAELWARSTQYRCKHLRGHKFGRLNYDEIAYGDEEDEDVLKMRLADTGGTLSGSTTPKGKNWYYRNCWRPTVDEMRNAKAEGRAPNRFAIAGTSYDNPYIDHGYLDNVSFTTRQRQQEILGEFLDDEDNPFIDANIRPVTDPDRNDDFDRFCKLVDAGDVGRLPGRYIAAWDIAKKADYTVGIVLRVDVSPWELVYFTRFTRQPWPEVERHMQRVHEVFGKARTAYDATGVGGPVGDHLKIQIGYLEAVVFTPSSKVQMIQNLVWCMEQKRLVMPFIKQLQDELYGYEWNDKGLETDCVMALMMAAWVANDDKPPMEVF